MQDSYENENNEESVGDIEETSIEKKSLRKEKIKKPKSDKQLLAFKNMQEKRRISISEKNKIKKLNAAQLLLDADKNDAENEGSDSSESIEIVYKKKKVLKKKNHKKKILFLSDSESESSESDDSSIDEQAHNKKKSSKYIKPRNNKKISVHRPSMYKEKSLDNNDHLFS
jgi:hypothetical protein